MLKHLPAAIFFLCLFAVIINVSLDQRWDVYLAAIVFGTLAMAVQHFFEQRQKRKDAPGDEEQVTYWRNQKKHVSATLAEARKNRDDRVSFLESQLATAERMLKKLGADKD